MCSGICLPWQTVSDCLHTPGTEDNAWHTEDLEQLFVGGREGKGGWEAQGPSFKGWCGLDHLVSVWGAKL